MRRYFSTVLLALVLFAGIARAHCQVPCGIYDDEARFTLMLEDVATIEKAMIQIQALGEAEATNWNQLVRWVETKELHADQLSETIHAYFLAQRIKAADPADEAAWKQWLWGCQAQHMPARMFVPTAQKRS